MSRRNRVAPRRRGWPRRIPQHAARPRRGTAIVTELARSPFNAAPSGTAATTQRGATVTHPQRQSAAGSDPVLITDAARSYEEELAARKHRYALMMGMRVPCMVLAAVFYQTPWLAVTLLVISIPLPWMAVLIANDRRPLKREAVNRYEADRVSLESRPHTVIDPAPPGGGVGSWTVRSWTARGRARSSTRTAGLRRHRRRRPGRAPRRLTASAPAAPPASRASRGPAPASHAASRPASNASPAPVGSTTSTAGAARRPRAVRSTQAAPAAPSVTTTASATSSNDAADAVRVPGQRGQLGGSGQQQVDPSQSAQQPRRQQPGDLRVAPNVSPPPARADASAASPAGGEPAGRPARSRTGGGDRPPSQRAGRSAGASRAAAPAVGQHRALPRRSDQHDDGRRRRARGRPSRPSGPRPPPARRRGPPRRVVADPGHERRPSTPRPASHAAVFAPARDARSAPARSPRRRGATAGARHVPPGPDGHHPSTAASPHYGRRPRRRRSRRQPPPRPAPRAPRSPAPARRSRPRLAPPRRGSAPAAPA